jgi:predicted nucleic acid-binding protein
VAALVDTNVLVYRVDWRFPDKQRIATTVLREGIERDGLFLPHQAVIEFLSVVTRPLQGGMRLLEPQAAYRETEDLLNQVAVLYPNDALVRTAIRGAAAYGLSWFDAHLWAYAEHYGLSDLLSEDFEHGRVYGTVRAIDPFRAARPKGEAAGR